MKSTKLTKIKDMSWKDIKLIETCYACPEQYEAYYDSNEIGYLRLRHGYFRAEYNGKVVYDANPEGDGRFTDEERPKHLKKAKKAIYKAMINEDEPKGTFWKPTMNLRFVKQDNYRILQQEWESELGEKDWRDIPLVE